MDRRALDLLREGILKMADLALAPLSAHEREILHRETYLSIMKRDSRVFANTLAFEATIERLRKTQEAAEGEVLLREAGLMECLHYLIWCEGPFQMALGHVCHWAIAAGHKFVVTRRGTKWPIESPTQVLETLVSEKARFLKSGGVVIPQGIFDHRLRNSVAHMDFEITDQGRILFDSRRIDLWRLQKKNWAIRDTCVAMQRAIAEGVGRYLPELPISGLKR